VSAAADPKTAASRSLAWRLLGLGRTLRPHQWVKNVFVLAPVVFAKEVFQSRLLLQAASAFAIFCLLAGAVYAMNDVADVAADRVHPVKRFRPIASGRVPLAWARVHDLPDFVYFDHSIHVAKGVGCVECHGRVERMPRIERVASLEMQWCLECHRERARRDRGNLLSVQRLTDCSTCHR
jgi:hypothetical protein